MKKVERTFGARKTRFGIDTAGASWADRGVQDITGSVLAVGLLPYRAWANPASDGVDLSGLGTAAEQMTPVSVSVWHGAGTDEARRERRRMPIKESHNRPTFAGRKANVGDHVGALTEGFTHERGFVHRDIKPSNMLLARLPGAYRRASAT